MSRQTISDRIYKARTEAELTQQEAADEVGVCVTQWSRWETGSTPRSKTLKVIARVLKVTPAWLAWG